MPNLNTISPAQLSRLVGTPDCPVIIDVCLPEDAALDPRMVPGSIRVPHRDIQTIVPRLNGRPVVIVCQRGLKLSAGSAAILRSHGVKAEHLSGGQIAWIEAGLPTIDVSALPNGVPSLWVTRHRPKIDRIACPWLITRFVDPHARFLFVPPNDVAGVSERFEAIPFDVDGSTWGHKSASCTFDAILDGFGLSHPALDTLATIVRAADTDRMELAPQAAGLLALSVGLSRQYKDDHAQLGAALPLYDALFRWARDGQNEGHNSAEQT